MIPSKERAAAEARALTMALALAAKVGWRFGRGPMATSAFAQYLYVETAQLLLVPTSSDLPFAMRQVGPVVRETRSDALVVSRTGEGPPVFAMATWARRETIWTEPLALWLAETGAAWLVPPPGSDDPLGFELVDALHQVAGVPFVLADERDAGFARAARWIEEVAQVVTP